MKSGILSKLALCIVALLTSCSGTVSNDNQAQKNGAKNGKAPKYIFYFVGDGMSTPQINMAEKAVSEEGFLEVFNTQTCGIYNLKPGRLNLRNFTAAGMANTHAENRYITCSAAAATALSTGSKTTINTISMNGDRTQKLTSVAEMAKAAGKKVGVITSVSIDHATPACFYAHTQDRNNYEIIANYLLSSGFDYFAGGFTRYDKYEKSNLSDTVGFKDLTKDLLIDSLKALGYEVAIGRQQFDALKPSKKALATIARTQKEVYDGNALPYNIDLDILESDDDKIVLAQFVKKGIELLYNDENGFFLFTEGGKIDWADHANDAVSNVYETIALDQAIGVAMDFYRQHPDETLIVFTGDHECGGLTLGFAGKDYESAFNVMKAQNTSFLTFEYLMLDYKKEKKSFDQVMAKVTECFGLGDKQKGLELTEYEKKRLKAAYDHFFKDKNTLSAEETKLFYGTYEPVTVTATHILDNKSGVDWASYAHTALPVPVFAIGCNADDFNGYFDNTDVPKKIMKIAGFVE